MVNWSLKQFILACLVSFGFSSFGTHLRTAEIIVTRVSCNSLTFKVKLIVYTNTQSATNVAGTLQFGDGTFANIPDTEPTVRPDLGVDLGLSTFEFTHTYASAQDFQISYSTGDRSSEILNMDNPGDAKFTVFVTMTAASIQLCNKYPVLSILPFDNTCPGIIFSHNSGVSDPDGDSLSFEMAIPFKDIANPVDGYRSPAHASFYTNFNQGNEVGNGPPSLVINGETGLITWDAPGQVGDYNIAFKILEWRNSTTPGAPPILLSTTIRDMQITVENCVNQRPMVIIPNDLCVEAGTVIDRKIFGFDPENNKVKIEMVSEIFSLSVSPPTISPTSVEFRNSNPADTVAFHWQTDCLHVRDQSYQIVIKITDAPMFGTALVTVFTWKIKVIAPKPIWKSVDLDLVNRKAILKWEPYSCPNAEAIQIWRKVGHYNYNPGQCDSGLPRYLGYQLIGSVGPTDTVFVDNNSTRGLVDGALYCYRLVAIFASPAGGKSYVSPEQCVGPIITDAPIITHVTVESTDVAVGAIRVSWRSPFDIDAVLFPKPYQYHLYRAYGFDSETNLFKVGEVLADTTFLDSNINTTDSIFNYRIVIYSKPVGLNEFIAVDTSFAASSVRLGASALEDGKVDLQWDAVVPWSNIIEGSPVHYVFRGSVDTEELTLIAKADVTENGFVFSDDTVDPTKYYCYTVMTRGTYGNPLIDTLRNFSQRVCLYPKNDLLPCVPLLEVARTNCDDFLLNPDCQIEFANNLSWMAGNQTGCRLDILGYNIYSSASGLETDFQLLQSGVVGTAFVDQGLSSFARCYRITAIDTKGQESTPSQVFCNDNCPFFELPNVFTPGAIDGCNDTFRAYKGNVGEDVPCSSDPNPKCLPFINTVNFIVYNRWGKEVFSSTTAEGLPSTIEWRGISNGGIELESGMYFYWTEIEFNVVEESKKNMTLKGWVHLLR